MSYCPEPDINIGDKVKVVILFNYSTKKELEHVTGVDIYDLAASLIWRLKLISYTFINWLMFQLIWII